MFRKISSLFLTIGLMLGYAPPVIPMENIISISKNEVIGMEKSDIVANIYSALNSMNLGDLDKYLAEDIEIITLYQKSSPIVGIEEASATMRQMMSIAEDSNFVFSSGPIEMGNIVSVEYMHHYKFEGVPRIDHNVSIFVFENGKIKKWLGYIHNN